MAVAGDVLLTLTKVFFIIVPTIIGAVILDHPLIYAVSAIAIVILIWLTRSRFALPERELTLSPESALGKELAQLQRTLDVPEQVRVFLDDSFNAGATETRRAWGIAGAQCVLILGIPLLMALDRTQLLSVLAHELGHFSRRHGRLGHWLYRTRVGWQDYAASVDESDEIFDRAVQWYAKLFVTYFNAQCFEYSRQCEYEADADAARATTPAALANALTLTKIYGRLWDYELHRILGRLRTASDVPPSNCLQLFRQEIDFLDSARSAAWIDAAMRAPAKKGDTHPSLSDRLGALGEAPSLSRTEQACAGESLLGEEWQKIASHFNELWRAQTRHEWLFEHLREQHIVRGVTDASPASKKLAHAEVMLVTDPDLGSAELQALRDKYPNDARVRFVYGAWLIGQNDAAGVEIMETLAREVVPCRVPAFEIALHFFERQGDEGQADRWLSWLKTALVHRAEALEKGVEKAEEGAVVTSTFPTEHVAVLRGLLQKNECVMSAWLMQTDGELSYSAEHAPVAVRIHILTLCCNPEKARIEQEDDTSLSSRYERWMTWLSPIDELTIVRVFYTTEPRPDICRLDSPHLVHRASPSP